MAVSPGCVLQLPNVTHLVVDLPAPVAALTIGVEGEMFEVAAFSGATLVTTPMIKMGAGPEEITIDTGSIEPGSLFPTTFDRLLIAAKNAVITAFCPIDKSTAFNPSSWEPAERRAAATDHQHQHLAGASAGSKRAATSQTIQGLGQTIQSLLAFSPVPYIDRVITYNNSLPQGPNEPPENNKAQFAPKSLDLLLLMALDPYVARALGLLFVDNTVIDLDKAYDYLVVAHYTAPHAVDHAAIAWSIVYGPTPPLDPPTGLHANSVPAGTRQGPGGIEIPTTSAAGLKWTLPNAGGALAMNAAVAYEVYRAGLPGKTPAPPPFPPLPGPYHRITRCRWWWANPMTATATWSIRLIITLTSPTAPRRCRGGMPMRCAASTCSAGSAPTRSPIVCACCSASRRRRLPK